MSLVLKLEAMCGDSVVDTAYEMTDIAKRLNIVVEVKFNDVTLISYRGGDPEDLVNSFHEEIRNTNKFKVATVHS